MKDLAILLFAAGAGYGLAQKFRLPVIPVLLTIGIAISLSGLAPERKAAELLVEFGLAFLVFHAGIELNPRRFTGKVRTVIWVAAGQFFLVGAAGYLLASQIGHGVLASLYLGFATAASSTLVVVRQLKAQQQMYEPFGRLVTGVLLIQDTAAIAAIVILAQLPFGVEAEWRGLAGFAALALAAAVIHARVLPWFERVARPDEELLLVVSLGLLSVFVGASKLLGIPVIAGAFLAGFTLSVFPVNGLVRGQLGSLAEFFQALFYAAIGSLVVFSSPWIVPQALAFAALVLLITPPVVAFLAEWQGQTSRSAIESGLLLAQTSELSLVLGLVGVGAGVLSPETYSSITLTCAITMTLTPFLATDDVTWRLMRWHPSRRMNEGFAGFDGHAILIGFGSSGMWVTKELQNHGYKVLVIDEDSSVIATCERAKIACIRGDGSDPRLLRRAGIHEAKLVIATLPRPADIVKIVRYAKPVPVIARIFEQADANAVVRAGGHPVLTSEAAMQKFLGWFEKSEPAEAPSPV